MNYCPYCSAPLHRKSDICPECKKVLDHELLGNLYSQDGTSAINTRARRKIWFKEHALIIMPLITLILGLAGGAIITFAYLQIAFHGERSDYEDQISALNQTISENKSTAQSSTQDLQVQLAGKDSVITIIAEQLDIMGRSISFTNRLARNSVITPNSAQESDFYRRNIIYLENQFKEQEKALEKTEYEARRSYSVIALPDLIQQNENL